MAGPDLGYTLTNLGDIEGELGDPAAVELLERALALDPACPVVVVPSGAA